MDFIDIESAAEYSDREKEPISNRYPFADAYKVLKLEILLDGKRINHVISIIGKSGRSGNNGDDMIIVTPVDEVYKIRTYETGILAI